MNLSSGRLLQVLAKGEKHQYAFLFADGAPIEEAIQACDRFQRLLSDLSVADKKEEPSSEEEEKPEGE